MKEYKIHSANLNNSLVFYRALFDRMPVLLEPRTIRFENEELVLQISEAEYEFDSKEVHWEINNKSKVRNIAKRMSRFMHVGKWANNCEALNDSFGLVDPEGNRWIIGNPTSLPQFHSCYIINN